MNSTFITHSEALSENANLTVLEFNGLNDELIEELDKNLVVLCEGEKSTSSLENVKKRIVELFRNKESKKNSVDYSNWEMGAVAELFIHLYMKSIGLKQECMYFNLEDRSAKKGFDGFYSSDRVHWVMESKSGSINTQNISHGAKLGEALSDLRDKFMGVGANNPWRNAFNHASHIDVNSAEDIRLYLKQLSEEWTDGVYHDSDEFNVIPCSTIYFEETPYTPADEISSQTNDVVDETGYKKAHFICVSYKSVGIFKEYIGIA